MMRQLDGQAVADSPRSSQHVGADGLSFGRAAGRRGGCVHSGARRPPECPAMERKVVGHWLPDLSLTPTAPTCKDGGTRDRLAGGLGAAFLNPPTHLSGPTGGRVASVVARWWVLLGQP